MLRVTNLMGFGAHALGGGFAPEVPAYANSGGQGNRTALMTITSNITPNDGTIDNLIDGAVVANGTDSIKFGTSQRGCWILFDFGVGIFKTITEINLITNTTSTHGVWLIEASNDFVAWKTVRAEFTLGGGTGNNFYSTNLVSLGGGFRYYRMRQVTGVTNGVMYNEEIELKIGADYQFVESPAVGSYDNKYALGYRDGTNSSPTIIVTSTYATNAGSLDNLVDGYRFGDANFGWRPSVSQNTKYIQFQFPSAVIITEVLWWQDLTVSHNTHQWQGSNDGSSWTNIGSTFTLGGATSQTITTMSANTTAYLYYRMAQTSGNLSASLSYWHEFDFKISS